MSVNYVLLKPFVFSRPAVSGRLSETVKFVPQKDPDTGAYIPTEIEMEDEIAEHPWIREHFADGCLESPERTQQRLAVAQAKKDKANKDAAKIKKQSEEAFRRATGGAEVKKTSDQELQKALNTPVNELAAARGKGIDA
jgi:hypothetical protein